MRIETGDHSSQRVDLFPRPTDPAAPLAPIATLIGHEHPKLTQALRLVGEQPAEHGLLFIHAIHPVSRPGTAPATAHAAARETVVAGNNPVDRAALSTAHRAIPHQ